MFIASSISNIFQNYNHCSLEMEQLSTDISIVKICLLNYFINCLMVIIPSKYLRKKKRKKIWKSSKIVHNVCREGHFPPLIEFVFSDSSGTSGPWSWVRGSCGDLSRQEDKQIWKKLRLSLPYSCSKIMKWRPFWFTNVSFAYFYHQ